MRSVTDLCPPLTDDEDKLHEQAKQKAADAYRKSRARAQEFDRIARQGEETSSSATPMDCLSSTSIRNREATCLIFWTITVDFQNPNDGQEVATEVLKQPDMLDCTLKSYQLKGLSWMANLYEQGINGILADEMGRSFQCPLVEK